MKVRFVPQVEINGYIIECDPWGPTVYEVGDIPDDLRYDNMDHYQQHDNAPLWVKRWGGPFEIVVESFK